MIPLNTNYFAWGVVEDNLDPETRGRVRVRVVGIHSEDKTLVPTDALPWSEVSMPANNASLGGKGSSSNGLLIGTCVGGIFIDPEDKQEFLVMFSYPGNRAPGGDTNSGAFSAMGSELYNDRNNSGCITADDDPETSPKNNSMLFGGEVNTPTNLSQNSTNKKYPDNRNGLRIKTNQDNQAGQLHRSLYVLCHWIQDNIKSFRWMSAGNDNYHKGTRSWHARGLAIDFSLNDTSMYKVATSTIKQLFNSARLNRAEYELIDEYNDPSSRSSGGHVHVAFKGEAIGEKFINFINNGGTISDTSRVKSPTGDSPWMVFAKEEANKKINNMIAYYDETKITKNSNIGRSAVFINYCFMKANIRGTKMDSVDNLKAHGALSDIGSLDEYTLGKKAVEYGSVVIFKYNNYNAAGFSLGKLDEKNNLKVYTVLDNDITSETSIKVGNIISVRWPTEATSENATAPIQRNYNTDCSSSDPNDIGDSPTTVGAKGDWANSVLGNLIGKYESKNDYSAYNSGTGTPARYNTDIDKLTIREIIKRQNLPRDNPQKLFATGRWQIIPVTLSAAVNKLKLDLNSTYNKSIQDHIMNNYLCKDKRPNLDKFLNRQGSVRDAAYDIAKEWASAGVEPGRSRSNGSKAGYKDTYYGKGNAAHYTYEELVKVLIEAKGQS